MFELSIKCSKDIKNLTINFEDGSVVSSKSETKEPKSIVPKNLSKSRSKDLETLDSIIDNGYYDRFNKPIQTAESTSIELPKIEETNREAMIAPELQNLDL